MPLPADALARVCGRCLNTPPPWQRAASLLRYEWPLDRLIQRFKFNGDLAIGRLLGELLAEFLAAADDSRPDLIVPVPLHPRRLRERGFNQALELAHPVSRRLHIPLMRSLCLRTRDTAAQSRLDAAARRKNLRDAFTVNRSLQATHVAIVDDVITTGATVSALTRILKQAGAASVRVWSLARAAHMY